MSTFFKASAAIFTIVIILISSLSEFFIAYYLMNANVVTQTFPFVGDNFGWYILVFLFLRFSTSVASTLFGVIHFIFSAIIIGAGSLIAAVSEKVAAVFISIAMAAYFVIPPIFAIVKIHTEIFAWNAAHPEVTSLFQPGRFLGTLIVILFVYAVWSRPVVNQLNKD